MPTAAEVTAQRRLQSQVVAAAKRDLTRLWSRLDLTDLVAARQVLEEFFPTLVDRYGAASAEVAAQWAEHLLGTAVIADPTDPAAIGSGVRWAIGPAFQQNPTQALANLGLILDQFVKQHGRDTIVDSAHQAGVGWARVPSGAETCAWCLILASRGAVYASAKSAGEGRKYHGDCDCVPTPIRDDRDVPKGYDPDALYDQYSAARDAAGSGSIKKIAAQMRESGIAH